jgi:hypothetical protein
MFCSSQIQFYGFETGVYVDNEPYGSDVVFGAISESTISNKPVLEAQNVTRL